MTYVFLVFVPNNKLCDIPLKYRCLANENDHIRPNTLVSVHLRFKKKVDLPNSNTFLFAPLHMKHENMKYAIGTK